MEEWFRELFSPEEIKKHAVGFIMGFAGAVAAAKRGFLVIGDKMELATQLQTVQADLAAARVEISYLKADVKERDEKIAELTPLTKLLEGAEKISKDALDRDSREG